MLRKFSFNNLQPFNIIILFLFLLIIFGNYKSININRIKKLEKDEIIIKLNNCFDLENKSSRSINRSLQLVEYCINKYGLD
tara:strand:- start:2307 stop:2549 length:243 start_codon:yes stop_codon:yes gene_type:complete